MDFPQELTTGKLLQRYKRFLADVEFSDGSVIVAHCANSGSMKGLKEPGSTVYLSPNQNPKAKLDWRWEMIDVGTSLVGINTSKANHIVEEAIADAKKNAERNGIKNIKFFAADVGKFLKEYPHYVGKITTIILDPPRAGIAPKTLRKVIELGAENIVYISCNPSTQARDTDTLIQEGYYLDKMSFVDQFPHTGHIESIAKYKKVARES